MSKHKYGFARVFSLVTLLFPFSALGQSIQKHDIEYKEGQTVLQGFVAYDESIATKPRAGILIVHEWKGLDDYVKMRAERLAKEGYFAFAADIYGKGVRPQSNEEAGALAGRFKADRALLRRRVRAALETMHAQREVARDKIAAIGYCFGGTTVLELARDGADVRGVVSFHGGLDSPTPSDAKNIKASVLVLHGADDPSVPPAQVQDFMDEMRLGKVDWQFHAYGNAVHSFTNPAAGSDPSRGAAYNELADKRSWEEMKAFLAEVLK